jgi:hypothetical protein
MKHLRTIACAFAAVLAVRVPATVAQQSTGVTEIGWLGLFNHALVEWLENENQLPQLCGAFAANSPEWFTCRGQKLAPKVHVVHLRTGPSEKAAPAGSLLVVAMPGQGLRAFFAPVTGGGAEEFQPDVYDGDWGYGPYFHQTFLERRANWFRLPEGPFPKGTWVNATALGDEPEIRSLEDEQIVSGPFGDLRILGVERDAIRARPEQAADMWCKSGEPPPLGPWQEVRIAHGDLYTPTGHLRVHPKYTRGC